MMVIKRINLWCHMSVVTGSSNRGSAKFLVTDDSVVLDLSKAQMIPAIDAIHVGTTYTLGGSSGAPRGGAVSVLDDYFDISAPGGGKDLVGNDLFPKYKLIRYYGPRESAGLYFYRTIAYDRYGRLIYISGELALTA